MGVLNFNEEIISAAAPARLFKALVIDSDTLIPKTIPEIQSVEIVEGNGGPGTVKKLTFVEDGETKHVLHKVEVIDEANLVYHYSIVGGAGLPDSVEKISFRGKLAEGPNGGSIAIISVTFETKGEATPTEEEVLYGKVKNDGIFKALEAYVLANPDYN